MQQNYFFRSPICLTYHEEKKNQALLYNCEFINIFEENLSKIGIILSNMVISGYFTFYFELKHEVGMALIHK